MTKSVLFWAGLAFPLIVYLLFELVHWTRLGGWYHAAYVPIVFGALPAATFVIALFAEYRWNGLRLWSVVLFAAWLAAVLFAHIWVVAQISGAV